MPLHSHADRDAIKARAEEDFLSLYQEYGGRRRGNALHCIFHADRTPSARIKAARFRCFSCNVSLDVFGFVARVERTDFRGALSFLADRYGVRLNSRTLTDPERREYAEGRRIREDAAYFADAAAFMAELALEELSRDDPERAVHTTLLAALRVSPEAEYRAWLEQNSNWAAALVHAGRERERRLQVTLAEWIAAGIQGVAHGC